MEAVIPVRVRVHPHNVRVICTDGTVPLQQVQPVFSSNGGIHHEMELWFEARVPALGAQIYQLQSTNEPARAEISFFGRLGRTAEGVDPLEQLQHNEFPLLSAAKAAAEDLHIETPQLTADFDPTVGLLRRLGVTAANQAAQSSQSWTTDVRLDFMLYNTNTAAGNRSGAYLFIPRGPAQPYISPAEPFIRMTRGSYVQQIDVFTTHYHHKFRAFKSQVREERRQERINAG